MANLINPSNEFNASPWAKINLATGSPEEVTTDFPAVSGITKSYRLTDTATSGQHYIHINGLAGVTCDGERKCLSFHLKSETRPRARLVLFNISASKQVRVNLNMTTGAATSAAAVVFTSVTSGSVDVGDGWWRFHVSGITDASGDLLRPLLYMADDAAAVSYVGTGQSFLVAGAQLETGVSSPTAYDPQPPGTVMGIGTVTMLGLLFNVPVPAKINQASVNSYIEGTFVNVSAKTAQNAINQKGSIKWADVGEKLSGGIVVSFAAQKLGLRAATIGNKTSLTTINQRGTFRSIISGFKQGFSSATNKLSIIHRALGSKLTSVIVSSAAQRGTLLNSVSAVKTVASVLVFNLRTRAGTVFAKTGVSSVTNKLLYDQIVVGGKVAVGIVTSSASQSAKLRYGIVSTRLLSSNQVRQKGSVITITPAQKITIQSVTGLSEISSQVLHTRGVVVVFANPFGECSSSGIVPLDFTLCGGENRFDLERMEIQAELIRRGLCD